MRVDEADTGCERYGADERHVDGRLTEGRIVTVCLTDLPVADPGFDITPIRLIGGRLTGRDCLPSGSGTE